MTTEKGNVQASAWTPEQEELIAALIEHRGMNRSNAVRKMRTVAEGKLAEALAEAKQPKAAAKAAKAPRATKPKAAKKERAERQELTPQKMVHVDELARKTAGKDAIEATYKSSLSDKYPTRYIWFGLASGRVLSVNPDSMETRFLDDASKSVKGWQRTQARAAKREDAKKAKLDKAEAKAAKK